MENINSEISALWQEHHQIVIQTILSVVLIIAYLIIRGIKNSLVNRFVSNKNFSPAHVSTIKKALGLLLLIVLGFILSIVWGVALERLYVATTGVFALIGIAFFAVWSILSNITSGIIIFFRFPFKIGDTISFIEERDYKMKIIDMTLFHIDLIDDNNCLITLPNNVAIQRVVVVDRK